MENSKPTKDLLTRWLQETGGWFIILVVGLAQLISLPALALGIVIVQTNAVFTPEQLQAAITFESIMIFIGYPIVLAISIFFSRVAFKRLSARFDQQTLPIGTQEELTAWRQITNIAWRFGGTNFVVSILVFVIPLLVYLSNFQDATYNQIMYTLFGSIVSTLTVVVLSVLLIEIMIRPARNALVPVSFENQLAGATSARVFFKFQSIILALIVISILLIAPLGYHMAYTILYEEIGSLEVFEQLQQLSLAASAIALGLGFGLSFLLSRSVSTPINQLIDVFQNVEKGDLSQRVKITATDEIGSLAVYFNRMIFRLEQLQRGLEDRWQNEPPNWKRQMKSDAWRVRSSTPRN